MTTLWTIPAQISRKGQHDAQYGASLSELIDAITASDADLTKIPLSGDDLTFSADGLRHQGQVFQMNEETRMRLFENVNAPVSYWKKHNPSFQMEALYEHAKLGNFGSKPTAVLRNHELVTVVRGDFTNLSNGDAIRAISDELEMEGESLSVARIRHDVERLELELVSPSKAAIIRPGDIVHSGISIIHAPYGNHATQIEAFILRKICSNGMTRRECASRDNNIARTRKLPINYPNAHELQLKQIRRLVRQTWNELEAQLQALRATSERPAHVEELLTRWLQRARISPKVMLPSLLAAWRVEGEENTHYGAVNALTRVATHDPDLSERQRRVLASLAGLLAFAEVHICPRCFSVLTGETRGERVAP